MEDYLLLPDANCPITHKKCGRGYCINLGGICPLSNVIFENDVKLEGTNHNN